MRRLAKTLAASGLLIALLASLAHAAPASDKAFTVGNYPVQARAKDAVAAKDQALAEGQQAAFRSLLKRIVPVTAYSRLTRLSSVKVSDLIDGVAIRSERNSATEYIASLDFSFQAQAVRALLRREAVPFIDEQAPQIVVLPVLRDAQGAPQPSTAWSNVWRDLDLVNSVTPVRLAAVTANIHADTLSMLVQGSGGADRILAGEYKSETVVAALAEIDTPAKRLNVTLAGTDAIGPFVLKRSYRIPSDGPEYAMELAAVVALGTLEGRWKAVKARARGGVDVLSEAGAQVQLQVEFNSLAQWNDLRQQLNETPGVEDLEINAVSARSADVTLKFPGGAAQLAETLAGQGLRMQNIGGFWSLRASF